MYTIHHGLRDSVDVADVKALLATVKVMLQANYTNILITQQGTKVTGDIDDRDLSLNLNIELKI